MRASTRLRSCTNTHTRTQAHTCMPSRKHARANARTHTHTQKYVIFVAFHTNSGTANASQCYFTRTLSVLLLRSLGNKMQRICINTPVEFYTSSKAEAKENAGDISLFLSFSLDHLEADQEYKFLPSRESFRIFQPPRSEASVTSLLALL